MTMTLSLSSLIVAAARRLEAARPVLAAVQPGVLKG